MYNMTTNMSYMSYDMYNMSDNMAGKMQNMT